jgi:hypothetical protein
MKVFDLVKQLQILVQSGQENLECYMTTSDTPLTLVEVVDIQDEKCVFCDSWTPVFEEKVD